MQNFFINKNSINPPLLMELIYNADNDYHYTNFFDALQDSKITFSMLDNSNGVYKISKAEAEIVPVADTSCEEKYLLKYQWRERDVKQEGTFKGFFEITFNGNIISSENEYPIGNLIIPIEEDLMITIK